MADIKYLAITIGPIFETMMNVTKPAGLWGASYLFSLISQELCNKIESQYPGKIITPYFEFDDEGIRIQKTGVGFYHDHIVVRDAEIEVISDIIAEEKRSVAKRIYAALSSADPSYREEEVVDYVYRYLQIYGIELYVPETENVLMYVNRYLDSIELRKQYIPAETENYISSFLENDVIKDSFLTDNLVNWQLLRKNGNIKAIPDIARSDAKKDEKGEYKRYSYFALVQSDGDRMGKIISGFKTEAEMKKFSMQCLKYTTEACKCISDYGGVVVYAGGDDLQFMAPLTHGQHTLFDLISSITEAFDRVFIKGTEFEKAEIKPSVSFGVNIVYEKYPLYEALSESYSLLREAKERGRDAVTVKLLKHSGQTAEFTIKRLSDMVKPNGEQKIFNDVNALIHKSIDGEILHSVSSNIIRFDIFLDLAVKRYKEAGDIDLINNFFINFFDNPEQDKWKDYLEMIRDMVLHIDSVEVDAGIVKNTGYSEMINAMSSLLRFVYIFSEKGVEDE